MSQTPKTVTALETDAHAFLIREIDICKAIATQKQTAMPTHWQPPFILTAIHQLENTRESLASLRAMSQFASITRASHGEMIRTQALALIVTASRLIALEAMIEGE